MARRFGEDPWRSVTPHLDQVEYPATREELFLAAEQAEAPADVINLLKSLPRAEYASREEALRDLAEAARRFAMGNQPAEDPGAPRDRRNLGEGAVEGATRSRLP